MAQFVVNENGSISEIQVMHNTHKGFGVEKSVVKALSEMPNWIPGKLSEKNVRCRVIVPIRIE